MTKRTLLKGLLAGSIAGLSKVATAERLEITPTTMLFPSIDAPISDEMARRIHDQICEKFPGVKVLVLGGGMRLSTMEIQPRRQG